MRPCALIAFTSLLLAPTAYSQEGDPPPELVGEQVPAGEQAPAEEEAVSESPDIEAGTTLDGTTSERPIEDAEEPPAEKQALDLRAPIPAPPEIDTWEYIAFPTWLATGLVLKFGVERGDANWLDAPTFDADIGDSLILDPDSTAHDVWARIGDVFYMGGVAYSAVAPFLTFNSSRGDEFAFKYGFVHFEALAFAGGTVFLTQMLVRRVRPVGSGCRDDDPSTECTNGHRESFPGGHTTMSTTVAALSCLHDTRVGMYDDAVAEWATCGVALVGAVANVLSRLFVGKHYFTDQVAGVALGMFSGGLLPYLLHPDLGKPRDDVSGEASVSAVVTPRFGDTELGLQVLGMF